MSTPQIWILLPGAIAVLLFLVRRWQRQVTLAGTLTAALLALFAWQAPVGERIRLGPLSFELVDTLAILGRRFVLVQADTPVLILIYLAVAFWFAGSLAARAHQMFVPTGLGIAALLTAALAVDPFLYAALLIEIAALVSIPLLVSPGKTLQRGVLRFLVFQTVGMAFLLFSGWLLSGIDAVAGETDLILQGILLLGLGFAFFLGVFPFHTWLSLLAEEAHPYSAAFIFFILPLAISIFGLDFLVQFPWLRRVAGLYDLLRLVGVLMVLVGGIWAAFQRHLGRMMGFSVMVEIGLSLLALGASTGAGNEINLLPVFFILLLPRGLALGVWALALVVIQTRAQDLRFRSVQGLARGLPVACAACVMAQFSLAGFPLLAGFPAHLALWENLAAGFPYVALAAVLGSAGLLVGGLRTLAVLVMATAEGESQIGENGPQKLLLGLGAAALLVVGLLPQWFLPLMTRLATVFIQDGP